jgi:hypothetical protein
MANISARNTSLNEEDSSISNLMELLAEEDDDLREIDEAAHFDKSTYDVISADLFDSSIILPFHLRFNHYISIYSL